MNLGEAKRKVLKMLDENTATAITADPVAKFHDYFDMGQREASTIKPIKKIYRISQANSLNKNLLPNPLTTFDIYPHYDKDITYEADGAKAYHFAVDGPAIVHIEELVGGAWVIKETIIVPKVEGFKNYKGFTNATGRARIRLSGDKYYRYRNIALWKENFASVDKIPNYELYCEYNMPDDFYELIRITDNGNFNKSYEGYKWQGTKTLILNYYHDAEYEVEYKAYPTKINASTPDTYEFEVEPDIQDAILFYVAAQCEIKEYNLAAYDNYMAKYNNILANISNNLNNQTQVAFVKIL